MAVPLVINPEAEDDLVQACKWYEEQRPGLGREFLREIADASVSCRARDDWCRGVRPII
jgi:hypothetical protein